MKYFIKHIGREVELNDEIVKVYQEYIVLRDNPFSIAARSKFGHSPSKEEMSDEELSILCNEVMLSELKTLEMMPKVNQFLDNHFKEWTNGFMQEKDIND